MTAGDIIWEIFFLKWRRTPETGIYRQARLHIPNRGRRIFYSGGGDFRERIEEMPGGSRPSTAEKEEETGLHFNFAAGWEFLDRNISCLTIEDAFMKADQMMYRRKRLQKEAGGMKGRKGFE